MGAARSLFPVVMALVPTHLAGQSFDPSVENCVDLDLGPWSREVELDSLLYAVPPRVVFRAPDAPPTARGARMRPLDVPAGGLATPHAHRGWELVAPDSIRMSWSTGWSGVAARVRIVDGGFEGVARTFTDVVGAPAASASLRGRIVPCDRPLVHLATDQRRLLRGFDAGASEGHIQLGDPIGRTLSLSSRGGDVYQLQEPLAPPFDGFTDSWLDVTASGHVRGITLIFEGEGAFERLRDALVDLQGPPTSTSDRGLPSLYWRNRTTWVSLGRMGARSEAAPGARLSVIERTYR